MRGSRRRGGDTARTSDKFRTAACNSSRPRRRTGITVDLSRWLDTARELLTHPDGIEVLRALLTYIHYVSDTPSENLHQVMTQLGPQGEGAMLETCG